MKISRLAESIEAEFVCGEELKDTEIKSAFGCDLMSDVLAYVKDGEGALLTGLANPQVVRTVAMMDMRCIVFVRNKKPDDKTIELAQQNNIAVLQCKYNMFTACGMLYESGLRGEESK